MLLPACKCGRDSVSFESSFDFWGISETNVSDVVEVEWITLLCWNSVRSHPRVIPGLATSSSRTYLITSGESFLPLLTFSVIYWSFSQLMNSTCWMNTTQALSFIWDLFSSATKKWCSALWIPVRYCFFLPRSCHQFPCLAGIRSKLFKTLDLLWCLVIVVANSPKRWPRRSSWSSVNNVVEHRLKCIAVLT